MLIEVCVAALAIDVTTEGWVVTALGIDVATLVFAVGCPVTTPREFVREVNCASKLEADDCQERLSAYGQAQETP